MTPKRRRVRATLIAIGLVLAVVDAWLGWRWLSGPPYILEFETTFSQAVIDNPEYRALPAFDVRRGQWLAGNSPVADLMRFYQPVPVPNIDYHPGLQFRVPDDATVADFRDAVADLAGRGYCDIVPYGFWSNGEWHSATMVILSVRQKTGELRSCTLTDQVYPYPTIAIDG
jgi:hypothetical protein